MAKVSISIPDDLKDRLDAHAAETGQKRSEAVANILTAYFAGHVRSPEVVTADQLAELAEELDQVRDYLAELHGSKPESFPRPEWVERRTTRSFISPRS